ncbi:hypothetical protein B0J11DRAFT_508695 [Dendryphion nanum]|uniref:Cupin 2 conserved barrel domain-containing protein n=1 Tax=Dendryphion nanum TaxID=256645 RepID=A0A9P9DG23_9PLEO|nr:hypothetical protein B0J11DRAFT_508695 [Dendryphion nanum]
MTSSFISPNVIKVDGQWQIEGHPRESLQILSTFDPPTLPNHTIIVASVTLPPNSATPPHRHGGAAVVAVPISGKTLNQMNGAEPKIYGPGDIMYEAPGCHHQRSEFVEGGEGGDATFIAVLVVDKETVDYGRDIGGFLCWIRKLR